jgi:hypothetical protein
MQQQFTEEQNEMTLKELLLSVKEYALVCLRSWKVIILFVLPFFFYQLYQRLTKPKYFGASLTFMVNDSRGSSIGGVLGQLRGLAGEDEDKMDKILELAKSRRTVSDALFIKAIVDGKEDYLANHLIRCQNFHAEWSGDPYLEGFLFTNNNIDSFSLQENRALYTVHRTMIGTGKVDPLFVTSSNKKTGIMAFSLFTNNGDLTLILIKQLFKSLSGFYVESTVRRERESYEVLVKKRESIEQTLRSNDVATAVHDDRNNSLLLQVDKVPAKRYTRNNAILSMLYGEVVKNAELAEFALKTATPYISAIDEPIPPLKGQTYGRVRDFANFIGIGFLLGCIFVCTRHFLRKVINE